MSNFEQDPFCYKGSEAEKADLAADQAALEGKWSDFMAVSKASAARVIKEAQMPNRPPEYRDFKSTLDI